MMEKKAVGGYTLENLLGRGRLASVYRAAPGEVAVKVLHKHLVLDETIYNRFKREVELARELEHPGIVKVYDIISWEDSGALVMEYCAGGNLADFFTTEVEVITEIARQIALVLEYAHKGGIIHRNIKPENLFFSSRGGGAMSVKIGDFGSAHVQNWIGLTTSTMFMGTPQYVAPEVIYGESHDPRVDLYALGAVLYRIVTRRFHKQAAYYSLVREEVIPSPADLVPGFPLWLSDVIMGLLAAADKRIPDTRTLLFYLEKQLGPEKHPYKRCLYCGREIERMLPRCLYCGKQEVFLVPQGGGVYLVLGKISEEAEGMHNFMEILRSLSGDPGLELKLLTGDVRLYSQAEVKQGFKMPADIAGGVTPESAREVLDLIYLKCNNNIQVTLKKSVSMRVSGPLIKPKKPENSLLFASGDREWGRGTENGKGLFSVIAARSTELLTRCRVKKREGSLFKAVEKLMRLVNGAVQNLDSLREYLDAVSLGSLYSEIQALNRQLSSASVTGSQSLIDRKLQIQGIFDRHREQERRYALLKKNILETAGSLQILLARMEELGETPGEAVLKELDRLTAGIDG